MHVHVGHPKQGPRHEGCKDCAHKPCQVRWQRRHGQLFEHVQDAANGCIEGGRYPCGSTKGAPDTPGMGKALLVHNQRRAVEADVAGLVVLRGHDLSPALLLRPQQQLGHAEAHCATYGHHRAFTADGETGNLHEDNGNYAHTAAPKREQVRHVVTVQEPQNLWNSRAGTDGGSQAHEGSGKKGACHRDTEKHTGPCSDASSGHHVLRCGELPLHQMEMRHHHNVVHHCHCHRNEENCTGHQSARNMMPG
mmetsp:Transcript_61599/g.180015  ORF Transcript_61599/g.180015 Transcript_61599/m.180015 type:complete len:250 (+) Transcript_61599:119-868(+)